MGWSTIETMFTLFNEETTIENNFEKLRQRKCDSHNKYKASYFCTNSLCVTNSLCFLCQLCYKNHSKNHLNYQKIMSIEDLFSVKALAQMKEDCKIDSALQEKINQISQDLDQIFGKLKETLSIIIDEECKKAKAHIKQKFSLNNEYVMKIFKEHEQVLLDVFTKDEVIINFNLTINPYLESFNKVLEIFQMQIETVENYDKNIALLINNFPKINQKHKDLADIVRQKISNFDELYDNIKLINPIRLAKSNEILLQKLKTHISGNIDKKIPRLHTDVINKIISYDNYTKYITCSNDKTIIIRNCEDNKVIRTLNNHKAPVRDILLLSDRRLASCSEDKTIKIWNLINGNCEHTLIGHSNWVYCLLELQNSILLSGSDDSSIGLWNISKKENHQHELQFYHQVKNDKQCNAYCMTLINVNELAVSSYKNINIYSFENKSFNIIKTLKGHTDWIVDIKLMNNNSNDLLVSSSLDKDCRLWSISQGNCLKIFEAHSSQIWSIYVLSEKIFVSGSAEIIFWNIDSTKFIRSIKPDDKSRNIINSMIKNNENQLIFAGGNDFIGLIKI